MGSHDADIKCDIEVECRSCDQILAPFREQSVTRQPINIRFVDSLQI